MITDQLKLRPRYGEVDQMGYVYHSNYVSYCHQARTELLRKMGLHDSYLESNNIMLPVISFEINYRKPAHYDELITIKTIIKEIPDIFFRFEFEIYNEGNVLISDAKSTVVFVDKNSRLPINIPEFIEDILVPKIKESYNATNYFN